MKRNIITICTLLVTSIAGMAQVVIHETDANATPDANAILDVQSTTKGVLLTNLSETQRDALPSPAQGLIIYNRTTGYFNYFDGDNWDRISRDAGTAATNPSAGTATDVGVGVGIEDPENSALLHVNANNKGVLLPRAAANITGTAGLIYFNTTDSTVRYYDGGSWNSLTSTLRNASENAGVGTAAGVIIGTGTVDASAKLEMNSATLGFLLPRLTTAQRNAIDTPEDGLLLYNADDSQVQYFVANTWYAWQ